MGDSDTFATARLGRNTKVRLDKGADMKHWKLYAIALIALFALGAIFSFRNYGYEIVHPRKGDITEAVYGLGKVKSDQRFEVIVGVISTVTKRYVNEGDFVKKGSLLIEFDDSAKFRAPFDGTVTFVRAFPGETAIPNTPILRLEDLTKRYIEISLEQQATLRIRPDLPAKVSFESLRGRVLNARVAAVYPREDEFLARISVEDLDPSVLPGMTADVAIEISKIHDAMLVPLKAVQNGMVTVRRGGVWQKIKVDVGHIDGFSAEIKGNALSESDEIRIRAGG